MRPKVGEVWIYTDILNDKHEEIIKEVNKEGYKYNNDLATDWPTFDNLFEMGLIELDKNCIVQNDLKELLK